MNFEDLPNEMILEILSFLQMKDLYSIKKTSKQLNYLASSQFLWKNLCLKEWREIHPNLNDIQIEIYQKLDLEDPIEEKNWISIYKNRQTAYNDWKKNLDVKFWLPSDYLFLLWWLYVDQKSHPDYLPLEEAEKVKNNAIRAGTYLINFSVYIPLILISILDGWWGLIYYFMFMLLIPIFFERLNTNNYQALIICFLMLIQMIIVAILNYSNDLIIIIPWLWSLSISLAMARSMKTLIQGDIKFQDDDENDNLEYNGYPVIILTVTSIIIGSYIGIAGIKAVVILVILFIISLGFRVHVFALDKLIGLKGLIMVFAASVSVFLYSFGIYSIGKRDEGGKTISKVLLGLLILFNLIIIIRVIMILFYGYSIIYVEEN